MKKLFILTISLILLFGFVSCDNATKEPTSNSNSTTIPGEITPPESSKLVDINDEQVEAIKKALANYDIKFDNPISSTSHEEKTIKDGTIIDNKTVSGSLTQDTNMTKNISIVNGELKIGNDIYKFNNLEIIFDDPENPALGTGSFTKNGSKADIKDFMSLSPVLSQLDQKDYSKITSSPTTVYELFSKNKEEIDITGTFAQTISTDNSDLKSIVFVIDAKVDGKSLQFKETISYTHEENNKKDNYTINYFGYDGVFFNEESIKKVFPNNPFA